MQKKPSLGMLIWNRRLNKVDGGCLHGLRRADLQGSEEETQQKGVGSHRGCGICGRDSGGHSDRPDTDAALTE